MGNSSNDILLFQEQIPPLPQVSASFGHSLILSYSCLLFSVQSYSNYTVDSTQETWVQIFSKFLMQQAAIASAKTTTDIHFNYLLKL